MTEIKSRKRKFEDDITPSPKRFKTEVKTSMDTTEDDTIDKKLNEVDWENALQDIDINAPFLYFQKLHALLYFVSKYYIRKVELKLYDNCEELVKLANFYVDGLTAFNCLSQVFFRPGKLSPEQTLTNFMSKSKQERLMDFKSIVYTNQTLIDTAQRRIQNAIQYTNLLIQNNIISTEFFNTVRVSTQQRLAEIPGGKEILDPKRYVCSL